MENAKKKTAAELGRGLKMQHRKFVQEWLVDMNATRAAVAAGYSKKGAATQASRLMRREDVRTYRDALMEEAVEDLGITRHSIVSRVWEVYERCMRKQPVLTWDDEERAWVESGEWRFEEAKALNALKMLWEMLPGLKGSEEEAEPTFEEMLGGGSRTF